LSYRLGEPPPPLGRLGAELPPLGRLGAELPPLGRLIEELLPLERPEEDEVLPVGRTVVVEDGRLAVDEGAGRELEVVLVERVVVVVVVEVVGLVVVVDDGRLAVVVGAGHELEVVLVERVVVVVEASVEAVRALPEAGCREAAEVKLLPYERSAETAVRLEEAAGVETDTALPFATRVLATRSPSTRVAAGSCRALVKPLLRSENERPGFATA